MPRSLEVRLEAAMRQAKPLGDGLRWPVAFDVHDGDDVFTITVRWRRPTEVGRAGIKEVYEKREGKKAEARHAVTKPRSGGTVGMGPAVSGWPERGD